MARRHLFSNFVRMAIGASSKSEDVLPITSGDDTLSAQVDGSNLASSSELSKFRQLSDDRQLQYNAFDEMKVDSVIAAALELYADDATQYDEQGRIIWIESDNEDIVKAGDRLLDIFEIPERAWKHIYQACLYGDYYLRLYRQSDMALEEQEQSDPNFAMTTRILNDKKTTENSKGQKIPNYYDEYVEDVDDPSTIFDLKERGKTAGFIEVPRETYDGMMPGTANLLNYGNFSFQTGDVNIYPPDRMVHIMIAENMSRNPEMVKIKTEDGKELSYRTARGKSILQDVYPIQREIQLLEDALLLNRLTRSSLIRLLEIELGDMPKKEVNNYLRRIKSLIEQHTAMDKDTGSYKSYNAPGPIDNVIYIPVRNGKGSVAVNNLGGDVNVRDIADIDYFNNKRAGALKIPRSYLGDDMDGSGLSNGGSLTRLDIRYARTIKRIQTSYIRAITLLLNLFFIDKGLDYVNKFQVRMTSPSTQEDLERNELINGNVDVVSNIMDLTTSLEGDTQKKILNHLVANVMKMPEIAEMIEEDRTPSEDIEIEGGGGGFGGPDLGGPPVDMSNEFDDFEPANTAAEAADNYEPEATESPEGGFDESDFAGFEDEI